jgi:hypothetical protein
MVNIEQLIFAVQDIERVVHRNVQDVGVCDKIRCHKPQPADVVQ